MKSAQEITTRIAEAKQELIGITNPVATRPDGTTYFPDNTPNDAVKAENDKKVIALNAEIKVLDWVSEPSPSPQAIEPQSPPEATDLEEKEEKAE